ncbi:glycoside hydrolase family 117 protein [Halococcus agarilyticus]|uniref:glycoside hydrolase family 117 protein n=1 Tax=Halococcus agarilyticus TaxID=1232219 RepID=UPI000677F31A|nr:family 43 glycosylhydrolase [Halococcus agarilyticus]
MAPDSTESEATKRFRERDLRYDDENEFDEQFSSSPAVGLGEESGVSRRDPSSVVRVGSTYYVWYTKMEGSPEVGIDSATDELPATSWDLADIWYATSEDGHCWTERGKAVERGGLGFDQRSVFTPDILVESGRYHLFYQAIPDHRYQSTRNVVAMASADSPDGPWEKKSEPVLEAGKGPTEWDRRVLKNHDPGPLKLDDTYLLYYKGEGTPETKGQPSQWRRQWGVALADDPEGPYEKSELNPVTNSGHETHVWRHDGGVAALLTRDGPEKNTIQFAPDGLNFTPKANVQSPPIAGGPYRPEFADGEDVEQMTWGLAHRAWKTWPHIVRFDC